jgi:hypothetical protein
VSGGDMGIPGESAAFRRQLDDQHYSSRNMPSDMLGQTLSGLLAMTDRSQGAIGAGADQFYGNQQRARDQSMSRMDALAGGMTGGFRDTTGGLRDGLNNTNTQIQGMFDNTLGNLPVFQTPAEQTRRARQASELGREYRAEDAARKAAQRRQTVADRQGMPMYRPR